MASTLLPAHPGPSAAPAALAPARGRRGFLRSLASLAGGAAAGQLLTVLASPIITRLYGPAELGAFSIFTTTALLLNAANSLRYEMAIPVAEDEGTAGDLVRLCFLLVTGFSLALGAGLWFRGPALCRAAGAPGLIPCLWLLPIVVAAAGAWEALNFHAIRSRAFGALAQARVVQGLGQTVLQVALGLTGLGAAGLITGDCAGRILSSLQLARRGSLGSVLKAWTWSGLRRAAVTFRRYPTFMAGASLLNLAAIQIPFLFIPVRFGTAAAGHFFLAYRTLFMPASFIGTAISQVFLGEAAERARDGAELGALTTPIVQVLAAAYLPLYTLALAGAGLLFPAVFGPRWGEAGHYAQVLAPMTLVWSLARPICGMLLVRDRLKESLAFTVLELVGMVAALALGGRTGSMYRTAVYLSMAGVLVSATSVVRFLHAAGVAFRPILGTLAVLTALNVPLGLLVWGAGRAAGTPGALGAAGAGLAAVGLASFRTLRREGLL